MRGDHGKGTDMQSLQVGAKAFDIANWKAHAKIEKFHGTKAEGNLESKPYEVLEVEGNLLVNAGIQLLEDLLIGAGGTAYNNANSAIAVGSNAAAATAGDTTLGTELDRKPMEATFPSRSGQVLTFYAIFDDAGSDGAWQEWGILNNTVTGGTLLNHKVTSLGTKSGGTWQFTVTITIS